MGTKKQAHYNRNGVETKKVIRTVSDFLDGKVTPYQGFCIGNVIKYIMRYPLKGEGAKDLSKAIEYLEYIIYDLNREKQKKLNKEAKVREDSDLKNSTPDDVEVKTEIVELSDGTETLNDEEELSDEEEPTKIYKPSNPARSEVKYPNFENYIIQRGRIKQV